MKNTIKERIIDTVFFAENIHSKNRQLQKLKGENFNVFNILDVKENEVKTHSAFIAELLNPNGSHNLKTTFLSLFYDLLQKKKEEDALWANVNIFQEDRLKNVLIEKEKNIGKKYDENGGRLDIVISSNKMKICIENKINADETNNQLTRYKNYLNDYPKETNVLIFLTKYGEKSKAKKLNEGSDYYTLSYQKDILFWLEKCFSASADYPIVRETIKQYIVLIKSITNQLKSKEMAEEIHEIIYKNIVGAEIITKEYDNAIEKLSDKFKKHIKDKLISDEIIPNEEKISLKKSHGKYSSIWIKSESNERIGIESFNAKGHENGALFIGLVDFSRSPRKENYKYFWWIGNTIETIWDRETLLQKLQIYAIGNEEEKSIIVNEIIQKVKEFKAKY